MIRNDQSIPLQDLEPLAVEDFRQNLLGAVRRGARLLALWGRRAGEGKIRLYSVLGREESGTLALSTCEVGESYPALTPECPQAQGFEREMAEQLGVRPEGHPWLKPLRFQDRRSGGSERPGVVDFFQVEGDEVHEVAVGPVHAGIIEPGHFRFQCHGERVLHLETALGYQHRGIEQAFVGGPHPRTLFQVEAIAGDTSAGHASAYCQALEALAGCRVPLRAVILRGIALELERLANHTGDLGALANDIGYLPTASFCGRIRGDFLNVTAVLCGSRFGRGLIHPGGVGFDVDEARVKEMVTRLERAGRDVTRAVGLLWETPSVMARLEGIGALTAEACKELGLVGPVARACGLERDVRRDFPSGIFRFAQIPVSTLSTGDVYARAFVRWLEIQRSLAFVLEQLGALPEGPIESELGALSPSCLTVSLAEGWRGEICHAVETGPDGRILSYKIVDPSFRNWFGLAMAMRGEQISDFPLCNKSFNLSYCGHDL